ncbi:hypothetical protein O6H91_19G013900 [Diphasiastrum complanatum]|uniref:Uncharacterized protein n=1 Tax=Diphasiastrum complanatum TaxID=34168 RepID=A0ACC2AT55_DIPCM|nr:hypothetical protein O6H91_19G013900 [Diphasiastrum complanatum]
MQAESGLKDGDLPQQLYSFSVSWALKARGEVWMHLNLIGRCQHCHYRFRLWILAASNTIPSHSNSRLCLSESSKRDAKFNFGTVTVQNTAVWNKYTSDRYFLCDCILLKLVLLPHTISFLGLTLK